MKTNKFELKYPNGEVRFVDSTATSAEALIAEHWGSSWSEAEAAGASAKMLREVTPEQLEEAEVSGLPPVEGVVHETFGAIEGAGADSSGG